MLKLPPVSLYIHIPWCIKKCPYCDFNSHTIKTTMPKSEYIAALIKDLQQEQAYLQGRAIQSVFIGGGTPSLFTGDDYKILLQRIQEITPFQPNLEITMEANPATIERDSFDKYLAAGINRVSIGVQSFGRQQLNLLGRIHSANEAITAIKAAQTAGFTNINIDLMHGLPEQQLNTAIYDLETAISLQPQHISWYQLTIEPNTLFYSKPPKLPAEDTLWQIQEQGQKLLAEANYIQYETSAYAKDQAKPSTHNLNYWRFGDYIGIGCGAHGKITLPQHNKIVRTCKIKHPKGYLSGKQIKTVTKIKEEDLAVEFFMNKIRLKEKIYKQDLLELTGINSNQIKKIDQDLLIETNKYWQAKAKGYLFANKILEQIFNI